MSWLHLLLFTSFQYVLTFEPRVFRGDDLRFEVHKYLVKLKIHYTKSIALCSGSILDNRWVITSAHCFHGAEKQVSIFHQTAQGKRIIAKVDPPNIIIHPEWKTGDNSMYNRAYDLALLRTASSIKFSDHIQPIKLARTFTRKNQTAIIAGFGESEADLEPPREGFVAINHCQFGVPGLLCSEDIVRAGSGDSGGSLVSNGRLIGVTSASCKNVETAKVCMTLYVSVVAHLPWIREILLQK